MAKKDASFFDRLREAGLRKSVARQLSEAGDDAGKKLQQAARATAKELRTIADEIERRLPASESSPRPQSSSGRSSSGSSRASSSPRTARSTGSGTTRRPRQTKPGS